MENQGENNAKLGVFVLAGVLMLIFTFYMIGKNRNIFGTNFELKVHFSGLNGLVEGDDVLFSGIQAGTVKSIEIANDTTIEVVLLINKKIKPFIHKNAIAAIGTRGLMGDKIVNISPARGASGKVENGDLLSNREIINTDEILQTLSKTNKNIAAISEGLKTTVLRINNGSFWNLLSDKSLEASIKSTFKNVNRASANANEMTETLNAIVADMQHGNAGILLTDTTLAANLTAAVARIRSASTNANNLTIQLNDIVKEVNTGMANEKGTLHLLLKDTTLARNLSTSMENVKKGTDGFNQNMEALKHNFLLRGYFKNLEKQKRKDEAKRTAQ